VHGNAWEWVQDAWAPLYFGQFAKTPAVNPTGPATSGSLRVGRAGHWGDFAEDCRSSSRGARDSWFQSKNHGFRVALSVNAVREAMKREQAPTAAVESGWHGWPADAPPPAIAPFNAEEAKAHQEAWAKYLGVAVEYENSIGMKFRLIPPGEFEMGATDDEIEAVVAALKKADVGWIPRVRSEGPRHSVRLTKPFWLGEHEVTRGNFRRFVEARKYRTDAERDGKGGLDHRGNPSPTAIWSANLGLNLTDEHPVVNVSWNDALAFCDWLSGEEHAQVRLPTEAQWEWACRAGTTGPWSVAESELPSLAVSRVSGAWPEFAAPVGSLRPNALGLFDMHGNVWEWTGDWFEPDDYAHAPVDDPLGAWSGDAKLLRGGSYGTAAWKLRSSMRRPVAPNSRFPDAGFRVVLPVEAARKSR
jgi:formylglycine-generating enzyme required for sulfatase activity